MKFSKQEEPEKSGESERGVNLKERNPADAPPAMAAKPNPIIPRKPAAFSNLDISERSSEQGSQNKQLLIGEDISLSGTITSCDKLVIAGTVETNISECKELEIARGGLFKGEAKIQMAEIAGEFVGSLSADLLKLRSSGRISGELNYGKLEVELGGEIIGNLSRIKGD